MAKAAPAPETEVTPDATADVPAVPFAAEKATAEAQGVKAAEVVYPPNGASPALRVDF